MAKEIAYSHAKMIIQCLEYNIKGQNILKCMVVVI